MNVQRLLGYAAIGGVLVAQLAWSSPSLASPSADAASFSGRAVVVQATVLGVPTTLSDTGPLPASGGALEASLLGAQVDGLLTANVLHASTVGQGDRVRSQASVADLSLTVASNSITGDFLMARATATCTSAGPAVAGSSEIVGLVVNGLPITVTGTPNQTVTLPNGSVVINEQASSVSGNTGTVTVRALHVVVDGVADVIVSEAHADITCQGAPACTGGDFVTGGGWITPNGAKATFAVAGGIKNGAFWGHLQYLDRGTGGHRVKGTGVTAYFADPDPLKPTTRHIKGTADVDGQPGSTYEAEVADNGEPGTGDTFRISLFDGSGATTYTASGGLGGGNIQLHMPCR
jgi:hypothetical protein